MSDEISRFKDAIRESRSKVITLQYQQRELDQSSDDFQKIQKKILVECLEQKRNSYRISIADSLYRAKNYEKARDYLTFGSKEWSEIVWLITAEYDMQRRLTMELDDI